MQHLRRTEAAKYSRQKSSTSTANAKKQNAASDTVTQQDTVVEENSTAQHADPQNVDMEDIFRSVLDHAAKKDCNKVKSYCNFILSWFMERFIIFSTVNCRFYKFQWFNSAHAQYWQ